MYTLDLDGSWIYRLENREEGEITFPGTAASGGTAPAPGLAGRVPVQRYRGRAEFRRILHTGEFPEGWEKRRIFLELERAGDVKVFLDGTEVPPVREGTEAAPAVYELTGRIGGEEAELTLVTDSRLRNWPLSVAEVLPGRQGFCGSTGRTRLVFEKTAFFSDLAVQNRAGGLLVQVRVTTDRELKKTLVLASPALKKEIRAGTACPAGSHVLRFFIPCSALREDAARWPSGGENGSCDAALFEMTICAEGLEPESTRFGIRQLQADGEGRLTLNGQRLFLRGDTCRGFFPEGDFEPCDAAQWERIMALWKSCGINFVRFARHCPPEAAFAAADRAGILVMAELPLGQDAAVLLDDEIFSWYQRDLCGILALGASHPSFCFLALGSGLRAEGREKERAEALLALAKQADPSRLYALSSDPAGGHGEPDARDDFFMSTSFGPYLLRGTGEGMTGRINREPPSMTASFDEALSEIRKVFRGPVLSMDAGAYEILPELPAKNGAQPVTGSRILLEAMAEAAGLLPSWEADRQAGGETGLLLRRAEAHMALRTRGLSGFCFSGLVDEPFQDSTYTGLFAADLAPRGSFADPAGLREFLRDVQPLPAVSGCTFEEGETVSVRAYLANFGKEEVSGTWRIRVLDEREEVTADLSGSGESRCPAGVITQLGDALLPLPEGKGAGELTLELTLGDFCTRERIWVCPHLERIPYGAWKSSGQEVFIAGSLPEAASRLQEGARVLLAPPAAPVHFPGSSLMQFSTWFGPFGTESAQDAYMGIRTDGELEIYREFPTRDYADWQWWPLTHGGRAMPVPDSIPDEASLIAVAGSIYEMKRKSALLELGCGGGMLVICSLGLLEKQEHPAARALLHGILRYMASADFHPAAETDEKTLETFVR